MGGIHIFEKPCYREIRAMRGRVMRGLPVFEIRVIFEILLNSIVLMLFAIFLGLYSSLSYNKGRLVFGILRYLFNAFLMDLGIVVVELVIYLSFKYLFNEELRRIFLH